MAKFLKQVAGKLKEESAIGTSAGLADAGKIIQTNGSGVIDQTFMPPGVGAETREFEAFEALTAGDFVNIFTDGGVAKIRLADASNADMEAHGYVIADADPTDMAVVNYGNVNSNLTGLVAGETYWLSAATPGDVTITVPSGVGDIVQQVGIASSATELIVEIQATIELA